MLTTNKIRAVLKAHGVIFEERNGDEVKEFRCYCYAYSDTCDIIRYTPEAGGWWLIDCAGNSEPLTLASLKEWLGY